MNHLDTFLQGPGDRPDLEVRLMAAELRRARRAARRCTRGHRGRRCAACRATLDFLDEAHGDPVVDVYLGYALGVLVGSDHAYEAALALRGLLAEAEGDDSEDS